jgi:hypothetical protein
MNIDYESFLRVTEDGHIWWLRKDAIRLGAGFLPVRDDNQTLLSELRAPNKRALVNERTLIGAFGSDRYFIERPMTFERDGFRYVDAEGFLAWLLQYIEQTQAKIAFPNELAREVRMAMAKAAASRPQVAGHEFESLTFALDGWFDKNLDDFPESLRQRVEQDFFPNLWDALSADQRRRATLQLDYQNDPATEQERQYLWNFFARLDELKNQKEQWESAETPTASDMALKESRLKELQQEIARMELQKRQARGDYYPERKHLDASKGAIPATGFIAYPKAMNILRDKWQATPEELAIWIFLGPEKGGIAAYLNANELNPPRGFNFAYYSGVEDFLSPLMSCWFRSVDIDRFEPADRYITGAELIKRWSRHPDFLPEAFIRAKIEESRLWDMHPTFGGTQGTFDDEENFPRLAVGLFAMSQIERIEVEDGLVSDKVLTNSKVKSDQKASPEKGGRPKGPLAEAVEKAYLHFRDKGDVTILQPNEIRSFLKSFKPLANDEVQSNGLGNRNIRVYIAERIKEVKIRYPAECIVITQDQKEGGKINLGRKYSQKAVAKLLSNLRKKYPLPS